MALTAHSEGENTSQLEKDLADALIEVGKQNMKIDGSSDDEKREKSMRNLAHPIAEAIEKGCSFSIKGTATVADINALKDMAEGDIWAVSDSGTIYNIVGEALEVTAGDLIRYDGTRWTNFLHIDLSGYVTTEQLNAAVATINAAIAAVSATLGSHADNKSNPHNVTAGQTGAYTKAETDAKIDEVSGGISGHIADKSNPHSVTAGQVGAYTKSETDTKISEVGTSISTHVANTSNPHSVTAEQVGAYTKEQVDGFIRNWSGYVVVPFGQEKPSASEAQLGKIYLVQVSNDPEVKDQYEEWISDGTAWSLIGTMSIDLSPYDKIVDAQAREKVINDALTAHKNDSVAHITAAERTSWNGAVSNSHTHSNKAELDKIASGDKAKWDAKQDAISDLATIRSGAASGATAVQPSSLAKVATSGSYNDLSNKPTIPPAITIDSAMSSTSTNPVQNKVVKDALDGKVDVVSGGYRTINQDVSKGANLVVNGNARMSSNYNWSNFKFYGGEACNGSAGAFGFDGIGCCDEFLSCDFSKKLKVSVDIKNLCEQTRDPVHRIYIQEYDVDKKTIIAPMVMFGVGTLTELTQDLKKGDSVVHLADLSNSNWKSSTSYHRGFIFWGYKNSYGYEYPPETYSRYYYPSGESNPLWDVANVNVESGTITLNSPWTGDYFPAGTKVSRRSSGPAYPYPASLTFNGTDWHHLEGYMNGIASAGTSERTNKFSQGVAFFKIGVLPSYLTDAPSADDKRAVFANMCAYEVADEATKATNATNVTGIVAIANGGTGASTALAALNNLVNNSGSEATADMTDAGYFFTSDNNSINNFNRRKASAVLNWIKSKLGSLATKSSVADDDISGTISDTHIASASKWNGKQDALSAMTADFVNGEWDK